MLHHCTHAITCPGAHVLTSYACVCAHYVVDWRGWAPGQLSCKAKSLSLWAC